MLLQTFVQLNILLMAAPALAGWVMSPVAHPVFAQAAQVILQPIIREAEATPQAAEERLAPQQVSKRPAITRQFLIAAGSTDASPLSSTPASAEPAVTLFHPFPHATRAP